MTTPHTITLVEQKPKSIVRIEGEIAFDTLAQYRARALKHLGEQTTIDGFRRGHIPEDVLVRSVGEMAVLYEMARHALDAAYPHILTEKEIDAVGAPRITITKIAPNNPLCFFIETATLPTLSLPPYKKIAAEKNKEPLVVTVTDEDIETTTQQIRRMQMRTNASANTAANAHHDTLPLPELTDEFVRTLGAFESVADFKEKMRDGLKKEKEVRAREKRRLEIAEAILADIKADIPDVLIEAEQNRLIAQIKDDVVAHGSTFEDYLKHIGKDEDTLRSELRTDAAKRATLHLVLNQIAKTEHLRPDPKRVETEIENILKQHKDASRDTLQHYVEHVLTNEAVFRFLDEQR